MSRTTLTRLRKLEVRARLDGSIENMTDEELFSTCRDIIARGGGPDAFAGMLQGEGENKLAGEVLLAAQCATAAEWMALAVCPPAQAWVTHMRVYQKPIGG